MKYVFVSRNRTIISTVVAGGVSIGYWYATQLIPHWTYTETVFTIPFWMVAYCFGAMLAWGIRLKFEWWITAVIFLLFALEYAGTESNPLTGILVSGLYYLIVLQTENLKILEHRIFLWLGNISYSTYILHTYMIYAVGKYIFHQSLNGILNLQPNHFAIPVWAVGLTELGCLGLATLTYYGIERPFRNLGRRLAL